MELFDSSLSWFKGNLHTHTTLSDGRATPEECARIYRENGYDFIAITDHNRCFPLTELDGLLVLPGVELNVNSLSPRICYHITGVGMRHPIAAPENAAPQQLIDLIHSAGGFATLAHPEWSLMTHESVSALQGFDAIEIYNSVSEFYSARGYSAGYIDVLAASGRTTRITAVDDTHFYQKDACRGFVMVNAKENTRDSLLQALRDGRFYASQGPKIHSITIAPDGRITVVTDPVCSISFISDNFYDGNRVAYPTQGATLTQASYLPGKNDTCVRIEALDAAGRWVWSNFLPL